MPPKSKQGEPKMSDPRKMTDEQMKNSAFFHKVFSREVMKVAHSEEEKQRIVKFFEESTSHDDFVFKLCEIEWFLERYDDLFTQAKQTMYAQYDAMLKAAAETKIEPKIEQPPSDPRMQAQMRSHPQEMNYQANPYQHYPGQVPPQGVGKYPPQVKPYPGMDPYGQYQRDAGYGHHMQPQMHSQVQDMPPHVQPQILPSQPTILPRQMSSPMTNPMMQTQMQPQVNMTPQQQRAQVQMTQQTPVQYPPQMNMPVQPQMQNIPQQTIQQAHIQPHIQPHVIQQMPSTLPTQVTSQMQSQPQTPVQHAPSPHLINQSSMRGIDRSAERAPERPIDRGVSERSMKMEAGMEREERDAIKEQPMAMEFETNPAMRAKLNSLVPLNDAAIRNIINNKLKMKATDGFFNGLYSSVVMYVNNIIDELKDVCEKEADAGDFKMYMKQVGASGPDADGEAKTVLMGNMDGGLEMQSSKNSQYLVRYSSVQEDQKQIEKLDEREQKDLEERFTVSKDDDEEKVTKKVKKDFTEEDEIIKFLFKTKKDKNQDNENMAKKIHETNAAISSILSRTYSKPTTGISQDSGMQKEALGKGRKSNASQKRVTMKHMIYYLETNPLYKRTPLLHKAYLK